MRPSSTGRSRASAALLVALLVVLVGCGGENPPEPEAQEAPGTLAAVEENLDDIRSGRVAMTIRVTSPDADPRVWEMEGPFQSPEGEDELPVADLTYRDRSGDTESRFVSDGDRAWIVTEKGPEVLEGEDLEALRGGEDPAGLRTLNLTDWVSGDVQRNPGEAIDGEATTTYTGEVDAVGAMEDLMVLAANTGAYVPRTIIASHHERVRQAVQGAELSVVATDDGDLLRKVTLAMDLASDPAELSDVIGALAGPRIELELTISDINQPIEPPAPPQGADAMTSSETPADA